MSFILHKYMLITWLVPGPCLDHTHRKCYIRSQGPNEHLSRSSLAYGGQGWVQDLEEPSAAGGLSKLGRKLERWEGGNFWQAHRCSPRWRTLGWFIIGTGGTLTSVLCTCLHILMFKISFRSPSSEALRHSFCLSQVCLPRWCGSSSPTLVFFLIPLKNT